jgi:hypothetical protein
MTSSEERIEERIKQLARAQSLDPSDAARLLDAVRPSSGGPSDRELFSNPFDRWSGEVTSLLGLIVALGGLATSRMGVRYDGALDLHVGLRAVPIGVALLDQALAFGLTSVVLWAAARSVSRARFIDVLGAVGLSRAPAVLIAAPLALLVPLLPADPTKPSPALLGIALVGVVGVVAQIWLLVLGFRTASGCRGGRLAAAVLGGLFAAELITKLALVLAPR